MDNDNDRLNGYRGARPVYRETVYDNFNEDRRSERQWIEEAQIRRRMRERRRQQERRRVKRNRTIALVLLIVIVALIAKGCSVVKRKKLEKAQAQVSEAENNSGNTEEKQVEVSEEITEAPADDGDELTAGHKITQTEGMTYVDNILVVNKTYSIPADYEPGVSSKAKAAFEDMSKAAVNDGVYIEATVSYVSYAEQKTKYRNSALSVGVAETDWLIERPGYSEHQTGLAFDVNANDPNFAESPQGQWLAAHCCEYGFILRYPQGKENKTGYDYNPWHIRYVGVEEAKEMTSRGLCLEEYLGITSDYTKSSEGLTQEQYANMIGAAVSRAEVNSAAATTVPVNSFTDTQTETWYDDTYTDNYGYGDTYDYGYDPNYDYGYDPTYDYGYDNGGYWY